MNKIINNIKNQKKGVLFTLIAILFAALFLTIFSYGFREVKLQNNNPEQLRVKVIDSYSHNFEQYTADRLKIGSYETLNVLINEVTNNDFYANNNSFNQAFDTELKNNIQTKLDDLVDTAKSELNINSEYTINSVS